MPTVKEELELLVDQYLRYRAKAMPLLLELAHGSFVVSAGLSPEFHSGVIASFGRSEDDLDINTLAALVRIEEQLATAIEMFGDFYQQGYHFDVNEGGELVVTLEET